MLKYPRIDDLLAALAEPTRRAIVERLSRAPASTSQLAEPFAMSLAAVVQHLQALEAAGIVASEKVGRVRNYRLVPGGLEDLSRWIEDRRSVAEKRLDRLGFFLAEPAPAARQDEEKDET